MSDSLRPHELQHARLTCPSLSHGACSNSCPVSQWCHPTISSSAVPFSPCPQYFPVSGSSSESALHIRWPKNTSYRPLLKCPLIRKTSPDHHLMKSHLHLSLLHPLSLPCAVSPLRADHYLLGSIFSCLVVLLFIVSFCKSAPHEVLWGQGPYQSCLLLCPQFLEYYSERGRKISILWVDEWREGSDILHISYSGIFHSIASVLLISKWTLLSLLTLIIRLLQYGFCINNNDHVSQCSAWIFFFFKIFLMQTIFKVFIEFVTILLLFYIWVFGPWRLWNPSSPNQGSNLHPLLWKSKS